MHEIGLSRAWQVTCCIGNLIGLERTFNWPHPLESCQQIFLSLELLKLIQVESLLLNDCPLEISGSPPPVGVRQSWDVRSLLRATNRLELRIRVDKLAATKFTQDSSRRIQLLDYLSCTLHVA